MQNVVCNCEVKLILTYLLKATVFLIVTKLTDFQQSNFNTILCAALVHWQQSTSRRESK